jgi:hypothetical protein
MFLAMVNNVAVYYALHFSSLGQIMIFFYESLFLAFHALFHVFHNVIIMHLMISVSCLTIFTNLEISSHSVDRNPWKQQSQLKYCCISLCIPCNDSVGLSILDSYISLIMLRCSSVFPFNFLFNSVQKCYRNTPLLSLHLSTCIAVSSLSWQIGHKES